jgi:hypothetical protein
MHGSVIYLAIRKYIYGFQPIEALASTMRTMVEAFLQSALHLIKNEAVDARAARPARGRST